MRVSIVMTAYNGSKYIVEQLESLRSQSLPPNEVIIIDDCSTDDTVKIIDEYIETRSLHGWQLISNDMNVGWKANFHKACDKATGDYIFFCDQDDVWDREKLKIMTSIMEENNNIDVLSCKLSLIDAHGATLADSPKTIPHNSNNSKRIEAKQFTCKFVYDIVPGCTMAVRKRLVDLMKNVPERNLIPHDRLYWRIGILLGTAYTLDQALIMYRIHGNNASNPILNSKNSAKPMTTRMKEAKIFTEGHVQIMNAYASLSMNDKRVDNRLEDLRRFCLRRERYIIGNKILTPLYFFQNIKYYRSLRMFMGDLLTKGDKE